MVFSPARLNLTWQCFQAVLLTSIALLSCEEARPCLRDELRDRKKVPDSTQHSSQGLICKELWFCSLLHWIFCFFFSLFFFYSFILNIHWSRDWKPVICSWWVCCFPSCGIAYIVFDSVNICVQSRKSSRGRSEWSHPIALPSQRGKAQGRAFSPGESWNQCFLKGWGGVPAVVCSQCYPCSRSIFWQVRPSTENRQRNTADKGSVLKLRSNFLWIWLVSF